MLAKPNRFHGHQSVRQVYKQGRQVRNSLGSLHFAVGVNYQHTKVAVVTSRKVAKSAVVRNRIRRRIYEVIQKNLPNFTQPAQLVLTVHQEDSAKLSFVLLEKEVEELLSKAKVI